MANDTNLNTAYIDESIEKINSKKSALNLTGLSPVAVEKSIGSAEYIEDNAETKNGIPSKDNSKYLCTATYPRVMLPISDVCLYGGSTAPGVRMVTLHDKRARNRQTLAVHGLEEAVPTRPF